MTIRLLPPEVVRQIAAGEVVGRPLDVVRELLDNALDAGATHIEVELEGGGLGLIRVRDNGRGIGADELALAPLRHATSKLPGGLDAVSTLGFRGEALWAIAQAGELTLRSRPREQLGGARLRARGSTITVERLAARAGTVAEVRGLFADLPARLGTQESAAAEGREVLGVLGRYLLHWPGLHWRLSLDGAERLLHAPSDPRGAVASVYGPLSANRTLSAEHTEGGARLHGVLSRPELSRPRPDRVHLAVLGRPVQPPPELTAALQEAYRGLIPGGHFPLAVLNLDLPPEQVGANVHPSKATVALPPGLLRGLTLAAARAALGGTPLLRAAPLPQARREVAPENTPEAPGGTFPALTLQGVYGASYLLAEGEGDLWIVDAHAAHERVLYEALRERARALPPVELPHPELLQLTPLQRARWEERAGELGALGLALEDFGGGLTRLRALPAGLADLPLPRLYETLLTAFLGDAPDPLHAALAAAACAPAVRFGSVTAASGAPLLADLRACTGPWTCPHGRPTVLRLSERDLARSFGRRAPRSVPRGRDGAFAAPEVHETAEG